MHDSRLCVCVCVCVHAHSFLPQTFHANGSIYHTHFFCTFFHFEYFGGLSTSIHKEMLLLCVNMCTWRVWNMLHSLSTFLTAWAPVWSTVGALEDGWIELNSTESKWIAIQEVDKCRGEQNDCWAHRHQSAYLCWAHHNYSAEIGRLKAQWDVTTTHQDGSN